MIIRNIKFYLSSFLLFFYSSHCIILMAVLSSLCISILLGLSFYTPYSIVIDIPGVVQTKYNPQSILFLSLFLSLIPLFFKLPRLVSFFMVLFNGTSLYLFLQSILFFLSNQEKSIVFFRFCTFMREYSALFKLDEFKRVFFYSIDTTTHFFKSKTQILEVVSFPSLSTLENLSLAEVRDKAYGLAQATYSEILAINSNAPQIKPGGGLSNYLSDHPYLFVVSSSIVIIVFVYFFFGSGGGTPPGAGAGIIAPPIPIPTSATSIPIPTSATSIIILNPPVVTARIARSNSYESLRDTALTLAIGT
jgi:hypothetical protein